MVPNDLKNIKDIEIFKNKLRKREQADCHRIMSVCIFVVASLIDIFNYCRENCTADLTFSHAVLSLGCAKEKNKVFFLLNPSGDVFLRK